MRDEDDIYIALGSEKIEKEKFLDSEDDVCLISAAENHERELKRIPKPMLSLLRHSDKQIKKKHLQAKVRLRNKKIETQNHEYVAEYFYNVEEWPANAIEILFGKDFVYHDRMKLAAFFVENGLINGSIATNIFKIYNPYWSVTVLWQKRIDAFELIFSHLEKPADGPDRAAVRNTYFYQ